MKVTKEEREKAIETLRDLLPPGATVYTVLRHVASSGMSRRIDCYQLTEDGPRWLSGLVAKATGFRFSEKHETLVIGGCGMDMGFHVVSTLSRVLFPQGFGCLGEGVRRVDTCPSNDHSNGDRDYTPHAQHPHWHTAGDYALRHRWL